MSFPRVGRKKRGLPWALLWRPVEALPPSWGFLIPPALRVVADSSFNYSIPPKGVFRFQTDGAPSEPNAGWVRLVPDAGTSTPIESGMFGYNPVDVLISESGIPSAASTTHARVYVDLSSNHNTGLVIANVTDTAASITIHTFQMDGVTAAGTSPDPISLPANGYGRHLPINISRDGLRDSPAWRTSAALVLLGDVQRHRLRRAALHLPLPGQERGHFYYSDRLLGNRSVRARGLDL